MDIDPIRQLSCEDVVRSYGIELKRGRGLCPFHNEKNASFSVRPRYFNCFSCGAKGDVIKFVQMYEKCSFKEAVAHLSERFGIPVGAGRPKRNYEREAMMESYADMKQSLLDEMDKLHERCQMLPRDKNAQHYTTELYCHERLDEIAETLRKLEELKYGQ